MNDFDSTSEMDISQIEDVDDFFKIVEVCYKLYKQNPRIFKIKLNSMVSDFKMYNYVHGSCGGDKDMIRSAFQYITMFDYIYKQQKKSKKHNIKQFDKTYIEPAMFAYYAVSKKSGLEIDQIKRLIAKRNSFRQRVFKN